MLPRPLLFAAPFAFLTACASYHAMEVRVMSAQGGGIANATVDYQSGSSNDGDAALARNHANSWTTDAAGRARLQASDGGAASWRISAPGFCPLIVTGSPDEIRVRQYGRRGGNHDAEPVIFVLEPSPPNAASDPKQFESQVDKKPKEPEKVEEKKAIGPAKLES